VLKRDIDIVWFVGIIFAVLNVFSLSLLFANSLAGRTDFRHLYTAAYMVRTGHAHQLYDIELQKHYQEELVGPDHWPGTIFTHPAIETLWFLPFSYMPYRLAVVVFNLLNIGCLWFASVLIAKKLRGDVSAGRIFAFSFGWSPIVYALLFGQNSFLLLLLFVFSWRAFDDGKELQAGMWIGLASTLKPQFVVVALIIFVLWKKMRASAGVLVAGGLAAVISLLLVGIDGGKDYLLNVIFQMGYSNAVLGVHPHDMLNIRGLVYGLLGDHHLLVITGLISLASLVWIARQRANFPLLVGAVLLLGYHTLPHDCMLWLIPIMTLVATRNIRVVGFVALFVIGAEVPLFFVEVVSVVLPSMVAVYLLTRNLAVTTNGDNTREASLAMSLN
jgi:hypothetical protein